MVPVAPQLCCSCLHPAHPQGVQALEGGRDFSALTLIKGSCFDKGGGWLSSSGLRGRLLQRAGVGGGLLELNCLGHCLDFI